MTNTSGRFTSLAGMSSGRATSVITQPGLTSMISRIFSCAGGRCYHHVHIGQIFVGISGYVDYRIGSFSQDIFFQCEQLCAFRCHHVHLIKAFAEVWRTQSRLLLLHPLPWFCLSLCCWGRSLPSPSGPWHRGQPREHRMRCNCCQW